MKQLISASDSAAALDAIGQVLDEVDRRLETCTFHLPVVERMKYLIEVLQDEIDMPMPFWDDFGERSAPEREVIVVQSIRLGNDIY